MFILIPLPEYLCLLMPLDPMLEQSYNKKFLLLGPSSVLFKEDVCPRVQVLCLRL